MSKPQRITIVDVLENALDGDLSASRIQRMTVADVRSLREVVLEHYDAWAPYPADDGVLRVHLGGWVASSAGASGLSRDLLDATLLYAHEVLIYDPVAAYFEPRRGALRDFPVIQGSGFSADTSSIRLERTSGYEFFRDSLEAHRSHLSDAIPAVGALTSLIRAGVVMPIPHLKLTLQRQEGIWASVRHLVNDTDWSAIVDSPADVPALTQDTGARVRIMVSPRSQAQDRTQRYGDAAYYLSRSLALASAAYSSYLPPSATEWAIYKQRLDRLGTQLGRREQLELMIAPALVQSRLPFFKGLSSNDLIAIRGDEEGFGLWRERLRRSVRAISELPSAGAAFAEEARDVLSEELSESAAVIRRAVSRSERLKASTRANGLTLGTGAAGAIGAAAFGSPASIVPLAITGALRWVADVLRPPNFSGSNAVFAHLIHRPNDDAVEEWPKREGLWLNPRRSAPRTR